MEQSRKSGTYWVLVPSNNAEGKKWLACLYDQERDTWLIPGCPYYIPGMGLIADYISGTPIPEPVTTVSNSGDIEYNG